MEKNRKVNFLIGIFDEISETIKDKIKKESNNCEIYGLGIYTDEIVIQEYLTQPVKKIEERMKLAKQLEGVDFVFSINTTDTEKMKKIVQQACIEALKNR